jgi:hypothetical protein
LSKPVGTKILNLVSYVVKGNDDASHDFIVFHSERAMVKPGDPVRPDRGPPESISAPLGPDAGRGLLRGLEGPRHGNKF